ncbi:MAG: RraA family protein [Methanobacteriaceae archaeon]|jgi:3-hexulose-6-phosphate synthase|nr:RraA family protein [Methanobacteriaceae archaeon]
MSKKLSPNSVFQKKFKKNFKKNLSLENLNLENVSIDDLQENNNFENYYQLKFFLDNISSCQLADAYLNIVKRSPTIYNLKSINNLKVYGKIFTCETNSYDWGTSAIAIDKAKLDDILFISVVDDKSAVWGEIASKAAIKKGIKSCVIYGSCRDVDVLYELDFPIFALNTVPNAGSPLGLGKFNEFIEIDNRKISNDDFLFADENGVIVIEKNLFNKVICETLSIKINESKYISKINDNISLSTIVDLK